MFCRRCGTKNVQGDAFCSNCGAPLGAPATPTAPGAPVAPAAGLACPQCGTPAVAGQRFCRRCGTRLPASATGAGPSVVAGPVTRPPRARHRRGCFSSCLIGCLVVILAVLGLGVGGYVAFRSGALTMATLLNLVGMGPGDIEVDNFRDDAMRVSILKIDTSKDTKPTPTSLQIAAFNISTYRAQNPGKYRVDFQASGRGLGSCALTVRSGDHYQFVALPSEILINRVNRPASVGTDLVVATSTLCR